MLSESGAVPVGDARLPDTQLIRLIVKKVKMRHSAMRRLNVRSRKISDAVVQGS